MRGSGFTSSTSLYCANSDQEFWLWVLERREFISQHFCCLDLQFERKMGVLDIPTYRSLIREVAAHDALPADEYQNEDDQNSTDQRPRKQRTPKLGRKVYPSHDVKRGNGVRRKRRNENLFFLYSLVDGVDPEELQDDDDYNMTTFGELFVDPTKMKVWAQFVNLSEEDQRTFLDTSCSCKHETVGDHTTVDAGAEEIEHVLKNPNFERISRNIRDFLRSDNLAKESLFEFEEDLISSMTDDPLSVLHLNIPSSFERMIMHGLCQYMHLRAMTHKFKKKRIMEIENQSSAFEAPNPLLSEYLETFHK
eukprot:Seg289.10 transcript_id=Seg289.10/GoldUCD/mRNA.D3Y31 product="R3H domain-containing protein 4" protein_id=Seg289.10/GoldUCD/D3Y31